MVKRCVLKADLKIWRVGASLRDLGRAFQRAGGSKGKSSLAPCAEFGLRDDEKVCITGSEGARGDMTLEEVTEVRGSQVIECFVGGQKCFEVYPLFDW